MVSKYEAARLQRMEENKKRMEELKLNSLALSFKNSSSQPKPAPKRRMVQKRLEFVEVRRSSRNVDKPKPVYKEVFVFEYESATRRNHSRPRGGLRENFPVASEKERAIATEKACEMELSIGNNNNNNFPSFVKPMLHSHVNRGIT
ncbi:B3 domain-containing protein Os06g0194400-like [Papaver somniferum]|uniref:B3 domain-containing protein Os06g0194400-like n=1 Tax=Papaver somniferum TaxID=3469 RepID=UPI000E6FD29A|nr:B3 domain-containing protein Os06g0194400-like [Papaver somniferum]